MAPPSDTPVLLYDGACRLCSASVRFIEPRDLGERIHLETLQSDAGQERLRLLGMATDGFTTIVLVVGKKRYTKSGASLRILRYLRWPWPALVVLLVVPAFMRDWAYDLVARNRYHWFGYAEHVHRKQEADRLADLSDHAAHF